jgi:hypothetical protein
MGEFLRGVFIIAIIAMTGAAIMQIFIPNYDAKRTGFGLAPGWQREIGFWNIAMIVIFVGTLLTGDKNTVKIVSYGASTLGLLLGTNHLIGFISTRKSINLVGAIENYVLIILLMIALKFN